jgi:hypothetical protein
MSGATTDTTRAGQASRQKLGLALLSLVIVLFVVPIAAKLLGWL